MRVVSIDKAHNVSIRGMLKRCWRLLESTWPGSMSSPTTCNLHSSIACLIRLCSDNEGGIKQLVMASPNRQLYWEAVSLAVSRVEGRVLSDTDVVALHKEA